MVKNAVQFVCRTCSCSICSRVNSCIGHDHSFTLFNNHVANHFHPEEQNLDEAGGTARLQWTALTKLSKITINIHMSNKQPQLIKFLNKEISRAAISNIQLIPNLSSNIWEICQIKFALLLHNTVSFI